MYIKTEDISRFPANWREIRHRILDRSHDRCEGSTQYPDCNAVNHQPHPITGTMVQLTAIHLNGDEADKWTQEFKNNGGLVV